MAGSGDRKTPLVADRRYASERVRKPDPKPAPKAKATRARRPARVRRRGGGGGNIIIRLIAGIVRFIWRLFWGIGWRVGLFAGIGLLGITYYYYAQLPPYDALIDARARGSVTLLDRDDKVFAWRGETFGGQIDVDTVSPYLRDAIIATEDKRFYRHFGISPRGIASAISINMSEGRGPFEGNGGSTITQQLAKLLCLGVAYDPKQWKSEAAYEEDCRGGGIRRKLKEIPFESNTQIIGDKRIQDRLFVEVEKVNAGLGHWEQIKKIALLPGEFTIDGGEMTPSLKLRRKPIMAKYAAQVEWIYGAA